MASYSLRKRFSDERNERNNDDNDDEQPLENESSDESDSDSNSDSSEIESGEESDIGEVDIASARLWCKINLQNRPIAPPRFPFTAVPGINVPIVDQPSALDCFQLFFDDDLVKIIVEQTNKYAEKLLSAPTIFKPKSRVHDWKPTKVGEIWVFLSIMLLQGIIVKPVISMYWTTKKLFSSPVFREFMSLRRFELLSKFLHFDDSEAEDEENHPCWKLRKIWPVFKIITDKFQTVYTMNRDVSIDESLLLFKGRLSWKQYIPLKRSRFGMKLYMLCESATGYIWGVIMYTGKGTVYSQTYKDYPHSILVVMSLLEPILSKGYCVTADNYYMSPTLCDLLIQHKTDSYGTVRKNRKDMPENFKKETMQKGELVAYQRGKVMAMKWRDKKYVCLLSTVHDASTVTKEIRGKEVTKPSVVLNYNNTMGGVDRADQCMKTYETVKKRLKKYYKKIFQHLLDQCIQNAFIIHVAKGGQQKTLLLFREHLIEEMLAKYFDCTEIPRQGRKSYDMDPVRLTARHFPSFLPPTMMKKEPTRRCVVCCSKQTADGKKVRKETRAWCKDCDTAMCAIPCFELFHTQRNY